MKYSFVGKSNVVSDTLKETTMEKLDRLNKFLPEETELTVAYKVTKLENKIEVTFTAYKRPLRAEAKAADMYTAIDKVVEVMEKQLRRLKSRLKDREQAPGDINSFAPTDDDVIQESPITIVRKSFVVDQLSVEDAVMALELSGHKFYLFRNTDTDEINVIFKSKEENEYGLIDPK